jgi:L-arabinokinase
MEMREAERELARFAAAVQDLPRSGGALADLFAASSDVVAARAPGRLDVMGGIADYSGSLVLELPLAEAACVAVAHADDAWVRVASLGASPREARFSAPELTAACRSLDGARAYFAAQPSEQRWAAYVLGGLPHLRARGASLDGGLRLLLASSVPEGTGVSSSAAIEVASLRAWAELFSVPLSGPELALACQQVENVVVGAPCGVMDQMTSACGEAERLLALWCRPAVLRPAVVLPEGLSVFGIDSGLRHTVGGAEYRRVRVAAFMGYRILAERLGARVVETAPGRVLLEDDPLAGYLCNFSPAALDERLLSALPEQISGAEYLARHVGISDAATRVDPAERYPLRAATLHPIYEQQRAQEFAALLPNAGRGDLARLGELMSAAHESYSACGLGSDATDALVTAVRAVGPNSGLFGAKISGGGSGGTVAILAKTETLPLVRQISTAHAAKTGRTGRVFSGSSPGATLIPARRFALVRGALPSG